MGGFSEATPLVATTSKHAKLLKLGIDSREAWVVIMLFALFVGLLAKPFGDMPFDAVMSAIVDDPGSGLHASNIGRLLGAGTAVYTSGKLLSGPIVTVLDVQGAYCVIFVTGAVALLVIAEAPSFSVILAAWLIWKFFSGIILSAAIQALAAWVDVAMMGRALGWVFLMVEGGVALVFAVNGMLLDPAIPSSWRRAFWLASASCAIAAVTAALLLRDSAVQLGFRPPFLSKASTTAAVSHIPHPRAHMGRLEVLMAFARGERTWTLLLGTGLLTAKGYTAGFDSLYATAVLGATDRAASLLRAGFSGGAFVMLLLGGSVYDLLDKKGIGVFMTSLNALSLVLQLVALLLHVAGAPSLPFWTFTSVVQGLCYPLPIYLPAQVYAIAFGGAAHAATISSLFGVGTFAMASVAQVAVGAMLDKGSYAGWLAFQTALLGAGTLLLGRFLWEDWRRSPRAGALTSAPDAGGGKRLDRPVLLFAAAQSQTEEDIRAAAEARDAKKTALRNRSSFLQAVGSRMSAALRGRREASAAADEEGAPPGLGGLESFQEEHGYAAGDQSAQPPAAAAAAARDAKLQKIQKDVEAAGYRAGFSAAQRKSRRPTAKPTESTPLHEPLDPDGEGGEAAEASAVARDVLGTCMVAASALLFGTSAALAKWVDVHSLFYVEGRLLIEWVLSLAALAVVWYAYTPRDRGTLRAMLLGASHTERAYGVLNAFANWAFNILWILALLLMPVGDATAIIYSVGPFLTGIYGWLLLGEPMQCTALAIFAVNVLGAVLVLQPDAIFGDVPRATRYWEGAGLAVLSTAFTGLIPTLTRKMRACHWTAVVHSVSVLSFVVLTPPAIGVFVAVDPTGAARAWDATACVLQGRTGQCAPSAEDGTPRPRPAALALWVGAALMLSAGTWAQTIGYQQVKHTQRANMMTYLEIPFAFVLQHFLFGDVVNALDVVGCVLILAMGALSVKLAGGGGGAGGAADDGAPRGCLGGSARKPWRLC